MIVIATNTHTHTHHWTNNFSLQHYYTHTLENFPIPPTPPALKDIFLCCCVFVVVVVVFFLSMIIFGYISVSNTTLTLVLNHHTFNSFHNSHYHPLSDITVSFSRRLLLAALFFSYFIFSFFLTLPPLIIIPPTSSFMSIATRRRTMRKMKMEKQKKWNWEKLRWKIWWIGKVEKNVSKRSVRCLRESENKKTTWKTVSAPLFSHPFFILLLYINYYYTIPFFFLFFFQLTLVTFDIIWK